ncbi:MAG TPA: substrate-binding domain-containing protein [Halanaerobiales bacterium]|nr:substrate-binding domain-containing protein [Halanaerobiales bacterium]HPZ62974.1 substrate-binding domain-containing protein [Halanaerobiales bacterium]HQD04217.1 substrate-binding domain-containing protein [Halanaerobiales bacterium]
MKILHRKYAFLILILFTLLFTGCAREEKVSKLPSRITIGVSFASLNSTTGRFIREAMEDLKERDNVELILLDADENEEREKENLERLLQEKVDAIIIQPVKSKNEELKEILKEIEKKNIPLVAMDRIIEDTKLDAYLTSNSFWVGVEQAKYLAQQMEEQGKVLILKGDKDDNVAIEISAGNLEILRKNQKIDIVSEEWHQEWSADLAEKTVRKTLEKHPDLKGILANNSDMAMAAVKVLKEKNLTGQIITVGADATREACLAIAREEHDADVDKMPYVLGMVSFKVACYLARQEPWEYDTVVKNGEHEVRVKVTPIMLIDKYNLIAMRDRWPELNKYIKTVK